MKEYKEFDFDYFTFIGGWFMPKKDCNDVIKFYKNNEDKSYQGNVGTGNNRDGKVNCKIKKCNQLTINQKDLSIHLKNYIAHLSNILNLYKQKYPFCDTMSTYSLREPVNIQHYKPTEGYFDWHTENLGCKYTKYRHLVFMTYLNTVENAGTEFYHQNVKTKCETGLTLIWPAAWTHTHRGIVSMEKEKFIITGWLTFNE